MVKNNLTLTGSKLLVIIPTLIVTVGLMINFFDGPTWFTSKIDPDYPYLFNGLNYAIWQGKIAHSHHPGTPLQLYIAGLLKLTYPVVGDYPALSTDVILAPEKYLFLINVSFLGMIWAGLLLVGWATHKKIGLKNALILQATCLLSYPTAQVLSRSSTEMALLPLLFIIYWLLFRILQNFEHYALERSFSLSYLINKSPDNKVLFTITLPVSFKTCLLGIVAGVALAVKITVLPLLLLPLALLPKVRFVIQYMLLLAAAFIVSTLPVSYVYGDFYRWIADNISHTGGYGTGSTGYLDPHQFFTHALVLFKVHPILFLILILYALMIGIFIWKRRTLQIWTFTEHKIFWTSLLTFLAILAIELKTPKFNYSIPFVFSSIVPLYLLFIFVSRLQARDQILKKIISLCTYIILGSCVSYSIISGLNGIDTTAYNSEKRYRGIIETNSQWRTYKEKCSQFLIPRMAGSGRDGCTKLSDSMIFASDWSGHQHLKEMRELGVVVE